MNGGSKVRQIVVGFKSSRNLEESEMDSDEDDDEDEEEEFDFSTNGIQSFLPRMQIVEVVLLSTGRTLAIKCRLCWTYSWLQAVLELLPSDYGKAISDENLLIQGKFRLLYYQFPSSQGFAAIPMINLLINGIFLQDEDKDNDHNQDDEDKAAFNTWLKELARKSPADVQLCKVDELLESYSLENPYFVHKAKSLIEMTDEGNVWRTGKHQPNFFKAAPVLFPKKFMRLNPSSAETMEARQNKLRLLVHLENITTSEPWKLAFSEVIYEETRFSGLEARASNMQRAWFYPDELTQLQRLAILLYEAIKEECYQVGHTYLRFDQLAMCFNRCWDRRNKRARKEDDRVESIQTSEIYNVIHFLVDHKIVSHSVTGVEERFQLSRFTRAEQMICDRLSEILKKPDWDLDLDLSEPQFSRLQGDPSQMSAARGIITKPLVMISGRGGTGKTEVVSTVLSAARNKMAEGMLNEEDDILNDYHFKREGRLESSLITNDSVNSSDSILTKDLSPIRLDLSEENPTDASKPKGSEDDEADDFRVLYCAPTGKAASVIKKRVGRKAFTIHQILASYKMYKRDPIQKWKFSETRIVAIDECSMVSIQVFSWLLNCLLDECPLKKIVLLGDHLQLPSVDPGNFMKDLYDALMTRGSVYELKTNHRSEGSLIFENAIKISQQRVPMFDKATFRIILPPPVNLNSLPGHIRSGADSLQVSSTLPPSVVSKYKIQPTLEDLKLQQLYWTFLNYEKQEYNIENDESSQIISFKNSTCEMLNQYSCFVYNRHLAFNEDGHSKRPRLQFFINDKIMCTKNADVMIYVEDKDKAKDSGNDELKLEGVRRLNEKGDGLPIEYLVEKKDRLMNGSVFKIRNMCKKYVKSSDDKEEENETQDTSGKEKTQIKEVNAFVLDDLSSNIVVANADLLIKKCKIRHAWSLSIHKFQGSETDSVVYVLSGSKYETWQHVYTAVTRGKKHVTIIGTYSQLLQAVKKKPIPRQTALFEKVKRVFSKAAKAKAEAEARLASLEEDLTATKSEKSTSLCKQTSICRHLVNGANCDGHHGHNRSAACSSPSKSVIGNDSPSKLISSLSLVSKKTKELVKKNIIKEEVDESQEPLSPSLLASDFESDDASENTALPTQDKMAEPSSHSLLASQLFNEYEDSFDIAISQYSEKEASKSPETSDVDLFKKEDSFDDLLSQYNAGEAAKSPSQSADLFVKDDSFDLAVTQYYEGQNGDDHIVSCDQDDSFERACTQFIEEESQHLLGAPSQNPLMAGLGERVGSPTSIKRSGGAEEVTTPTKQLKLGEVSLTDSQLLEQFEDPWDEPDL